MIFALLVGIVATLFFVAFARQILTFLLMLLCGYAVYLLGMVVLTIAGAKY